MFRIEALPARHGDCLLLHWGDAAKPRLALIDGGPAGTYKGVLKKRLQQLASDAGGDRVTLELMMLSHIDDDHINGLLALADDIEEGTAPAEVLLLWHNSLEGLLEGKLPEPANHIATASVAAGFSRTSRGGDEWAQKVLASVPQGQHLHAFAKREGLDTTMNDPFAPLVMARDGQRAANIAGLELVVIAPDAQAVENLRKAWKRHRKEGITAGYDDPSPYNLSSIVVVARFDGKSMLLTGDALGNEVMDGLKQKNISDQEGRAHFDLIKLPHHGSRNNVAIDFFRNITADVYLVSGDGPDGRFPNPHPEAMNWLKEARGGDDYVICCTYDLPYMREIFGPRLRVPAAGETGVTVTLA
jgi:hypothetical protein